jgi:hypothetical protein
MTIAAIQAQPGDEKLAELFTRMEPRRNVLLGVLDLCREGKDARAVAEYVSQAQRTNRSVFSAGSILTLLEEAGGLARTAQDGSAWPTEPAEPEHVFVDGVEYLRAAPSRLLFWKTTAAGLRVSEGDRPLGRVEDLFSCDVEYLPVYKRVLLLCGEDGGASAGRLGAAVDKLDVVKEPRLFAAHFTERLEHAGAVEWSDAWVLTDVGVQALDMLSDVEAA